MARRKNGGVIGSATDYPRAGLVSGVFTMDEITAFSEDEGHVVSTERNYSPIEWPSTNGLSGSIDRDPYYSLVGAQLGQLETDNWMGRDQGYYGWHEYNTNDGFARFPISSYHGPRYEDWASHFQATGYYTVADNVTYSTNPFTIEFWINLEKQPGTWMYVMGKSNVAGNTANGTGWQISINNLLQIGFHNANGAGATTFTTTTLKTDKWYHVAMVRSNTAADGFKIYVNGAAYATGTVSSNMVNSTNMVIGRDSAATVATYFGSKLSDIRISNVAIYDTDFTPPTSNLTIDPSTTIFSHSMRDRTHGSHANVQPQGKTVTVTGSVLRTVEGPLRSNVTLEQDFGYNSAFAYSTNANKYNIHDTNPNNTSLRFGTNPFTVEAWICPNNAGTGTVGIAGKGTLNSGAAGASGWNLYANSSAVVWDDGQSVISGRGTFTINPGEWHHVAAVREGTGSGQFKIYVDGIQATTTVSTVSTNYTQTANLFLMSTRNNQYNTRGWVSGIRISNVARYWSNTVSNTDFIANTMVVDTNTLLLMATSGNSRPRSITPSWTNHGTYKTDVIRHRSTTEHRHGGHNPINRQGSKMARSFLGTAQNSYIASSTADLDFGTGDFSIEFWMSVRTKLVTTDYDYLIETRATFNDSGIAIRYGYGNMDGIHVLSANTFILGDTLTGQDIRQWRHVCVQRTNGSLALYVNGKKSQETRWTAAIDSTNNRMEIGNSTRTTIDYTQNFSGYMADLRVCKGEAPYAVGGVNPDRIQIPTKWLSATAGTVIQALNHPINYDFLDRNNYIGWNLQQLTSGSQDAYPYAMAPYNPPTDWDSENYIFSDTYDATSGFATAEGFYTAASTNHTYSWITRMSVPWTIEGWLYCGVTNTATVTAYSFMGTGTAAGHEGWELLWNYGNGAVSNGNISFRLWTAHNSGAQYFYSAETTPWTLRNSSWNYIAIQHDPTATNVLAMFINGKRVAVRAAFNPVGRLEYNTSAFTAGVTNTGLGSWRISTIARYSNDLTSHTVPSAPYTYDEYSHTIIESSKHSMMSEATHNAMWLYYNVFPSNYSKFGRGSIRISNKDTGLITDRIIYAVNLANNRPFDLQYSDWTFELWATWWDATAGGKAFTATTGNVLAHVFNGLWIGCTAAGLWQFRRQTTGTVYVVANTTKTVATKTAGTWDHLCITRRSGNYYFYVNGEEVGKAYGANSGTFTNGPSVNISDDWNTVPNHFIGCDASATASTAWCGYVHDIRLTFTCRYTTKVINGVPTMIDRYTYQPALPKKLNPTR